MSREDVEVVRSVYAAWERGHYSATEWAHPEIEHVFADGPTPGSSTGVAGMAEAWRDFLGVWEALAPKVDEYRDLDGGGVLVLYLNRAHALEAVGLRG